MHSGQAFSRMPPVWLVLCLFILFPVACCKPPVKINLISDGTAYEPDAPIQVQVSVANDKTDIFGRKQAVITRRGFFDQDFHLRLTIIDSDGNPVAKIRPESVVEPAPPYRSGDQFIVPAEIIPPDAKNIYFMKDLRDYYRIDDRAGWYTAQVRASLETFCRYTEATSGELSAELFARCNRNYNPLVSNKIRFELLPSEKILEATILVGVRNNRKALEFAEVRIYRARQIPKDDRSLDRQAVRNIWNQVTPKGALLTNSKGEAVFSGIERDTYLILARHPAFESAVITGQWITEADNRWQTGKVVAIDLSAPR